MLYTPKIMALLEQDWMLKVLLNDYTFNFFLFCDYAYVCICLCITGIFSCNLFFLGGALSSKLVLFVNKCNSRVI